MTYPTIPNLNQLVEQIQLYAQLKHEYGSPDIDKIVAKAYKTLLPVLHELKHLPVNTELARKEPDYWPYEPELFDFALSGNTPRKLRP
ncbi:hypothetical protein KAH55_04075 [bacterium]|nr:hypothetical protein [bacterium]